MATVAVVVGGDLFLLVFTIAVVVWVVLLLHHHLLLLLHHRLHPSIAVPKICACASTATGTRPRVLHICTSSKSSSAFRSSFFLRRRLFRRLFSGRRRRRNASATVMRLSRPRVPRDALSRSRHYYYGQNEHTTLLKKTENEYSA